MWIVLLWSVAVLGWLPATPAVANLTAANAPDLSAVEPIARPAPAGRSLLVIHYHRPDGDYAGWNVWAWADGREGRAYAFTAASPFGRTALIELPADASQGNFIVRRNDWEQKDVGHDRAVPFDADRVAEVWLVSGDPAVYGDVDEIDFEPKVRAAYLDAPRRLRVALSRPVAVDEIDPRSVRFTVGEDAIGVSSLAAAKGNPHAAGVLDVQLAEAVTALPMHEPMRFTLPGVEPAMVTPRDVLNDKAWAALDAEFGPAWTPEATRFRTWSPVSRRVELLLFDSADDAEPTRRIDLSRGDRGVWEANVAGDLDGVFYQYRFHRLGEAVTVPDIHAFAATSDSRRSMVVNLARTDPEGFASHEVPVLARPTDEVIYEIHVRDYSVDDPNVPEHHRGRYLGMTHDAPADRSAIPGVATSLTHLEELGVTAVHLLPIQDFGSERHEYNWGYWTSLFNVPESQYSTTPGDPANTIRELKQTIQALHGRGIRVILDVVYNHTSISSDPNPYEAAMPGYFLRRTDTGEYRNDAGTGNSVADERPMVRKYIVDSLAFWTRHYKVDGFRFDLVGTHHPETVAAITDRLRAIRGDITLYGEPWTGGGPTYFGKGAQRGTGFAVFNDHFRNALRGDLDGSATGFATGPGGNTGDVRRGLAGAISDFADSPVETVNYVSAHDNRSFWDKLVYSHGPSVNDAMKQRMLRLAHGAVLTAQGIAFIHGGADFARTKQGHHNSYNAGDEINRFDWRRKGEYLATHRYLAGLIELRRAHPAFRLTSAEEVRQHLRFLEPRSAVVAFALNGEAVGDPWRRILVALNGGPIPRSLDLPRGTWHVAVDHRRAGVKPVGRARSRVVLPPYSMWVGFQE